MLKFDDETLAKNEIQKSDIETDILDNQIAQAQDYLRTGDYKKARAMFLKLSEQNQEDARIYLGLANSSFYLGMNTYAKDYFEKAIQLDNTNYDVLLKYSQVLYELKEFDIALDVIDRAIDTTKNDDKLYYNKSLINFNIEKYELALNDIKKAISINPEVADYFYLQGMILEKSQKLKDAIYSYEQFLEMAQDEETKAYIQLKIKLLYDDVVK